MKVIKENKFSMRIKCERTVDMYGFSYGKENDFCGSELEIDADDIKKHRWFKYPDYEGIDYGVICPICGKFITIDTKNIPDIIMNIAEEIYLNK